jgi:hypothetical protein
LAIYISEDLLAFMFERAQGDSRMAREDNLSEYGTYPKDSTASDISIWSPSLTKSDQDSLIHRQVYMGFTRPVD